MDGLDKDENHIDRFIDLDRNSRYLARLSVQCLVCYYSPPRISMSILIHRLSLLYILYTNSSPITKKEVAYASACYLISILYYVVRYLSKYQNN